jgi:hypothetical protein
MLLSSLVEPHLARLVAILEHERARDQPMGIRGYQHRSGSSHRLGPCSDIGSVAEDVCVPAGARANDHPPESMPILADNFACAGCSLSFDIARGSQARACGTLCIVVVGLGIAEEVHHAVAKALGDVATEAG